MEQIKKNGFWIALIVGLMVVFLNRYMELPISVVLHPDSQITFGTENKVLEQTWQPDVKRITAVKMPYYAENDFTADVQIRVFDDTYTQVLAENVINGYHFAAEQGGSIDFDLGRIRVIPGERYRIQISLTNASVEGVLKVDAGSNYGGCTVAGEDTKAAAALTITFAKYSKIFWMVAVLFPLCAYSLFMMVILGRKFEETVTLAMCLEGLTLYIFALMGALTTGLNVVYGAAVVLLGVSICLYNKKNIKLKELYSPGLLIYLGFFLVIILTSHGDRLGQRDDLRHWGSAVRDMFYYDSLAKHLDTTVILPRYFPFTALIEYVFEFMNGLFSEEILLIAFQTMVLSVFIILCKSLKRMTDVKKLLPVLVMMVCIPVTFFVSITSELLVDPLQMALMVYVLICYYTEKESKFTYVRIFVALITLVVIKDIGLVFAGLMALIIFGDMAIGQIRNKKLKLKQLAYPVICVVMVMAAYLSWQIYLSIPAKSAREVKVSTESQETETGTEKEETQQVATGISTSGISVGGLIKVLSGNGEEYQYQSTRNFIIALMEASTYSFGRISISFVDLLAVIIFISVSLGYFGYWGDKKGVMYTFAGMILLGSIALCAFLQITYWFTFAPYEAVMLASMSRYLAPYVCTVIIVSFYLVCEYSETEYVKNNRWTYVVAVLTLFFAINMPVTHLVIEKYEEEDNTSEEIIYGHSDIKSILRSVAQRGERVQFICADSDGYSEYIFRNAVCPIVSEHSWWWMVGSKEKWLELEKEASENGDAYFADVVSVKELEERLQKCQYVVVFHADEGFIQSYAELFGGAENIVDGSVYEIENVQGKTSLELIGTTGIKEWR